MKKSTKLLSVLLAFVMVLSCMTMLASAAKTKYQTVADLEALEAYSPYYTVTRLTTEERASIVLDSLDQLLESANIKMDDIKILFWTIKLNFTSVTNLCASLDSFYDVKGALGIIGGTIKKLKLDSWQTGMTRDKTAQLAILNEILELLSTNTTAIDSILTDGLSLGLVGSFIKGLNLGPINKIAKNLPALVNGIVLPLMGRQDDKATDRATLSNKDANLVDVAQNFVNGLFTKPMNWTSYRVDAAGNSLGYTLDLPTEAEGTSRYFKINGNEITQYDYKYEGALGNPKAGFVETVTYTKDKEFDTEDCTTYVFRAPEGYEGDETLKWYKADGFIEPSTGRIQSSYWLPSIKEAFDNGTLSIAINGSDSVLGLIYKFIPYVFAEMAPVVLNGSAKKLMAEAFDVVFTEIGKKGDASLPNDPFFTAPQEFYVWEYSAYKVIDGVPYYRFQDQFYKGEIPSNISVFYSMINWNYEIKGDFFNEFIPTTVGSTWALDSLNNIVAKAINSMIEDTWTVKGKTYTRSTVFPWATGDNSKLLNNLMVCARNFFNIAPEEIFDEYVAEAQFYKAMMNGTLKQAANGLVCELVKLIMPQIKFADNIVDQPITAIAAVVVRELCTQLMPSYNFDAMIYANYGDSTENSNRVMRSESADYWLDTTLYMGVNLGMFYLRNIADIGEDNKGNVVASDTTKRGYYSVMSSLGALPIDTKKEGTIAAGDAITFAADSQYTTIDGNKVASWLVAVDWIVDWALSNEVEWAWHFDRLVDCGSTVSLATYENPLNKIDTVLLKLLPLDQLLNVSEFTGSTYGSGTFVEKVLKDGLVDSIVNLDVVNLLKLTKIPDGYFRQGNILDSLVKIVVNLLDAVLYKAAGNTDIINKTKINSVTTLLNHANIKEVVVTLVGKLYAASKSHGIFDAIFPIANFFIGWTTDPQKYSEPNIVVTNSGNDSFLLSTATNSIKVQNTSSGMLLKHRNSTVEDEPYVITIKAIDFGDSGITITETLPKDLNPGESANIIMTVPAKDGVAKITVTYGFKGKDGKAIGGDMTKIAYVYMSTIDDDENIAGRAAGDDDDNYNGIAEYNKYVFTTDIYNAITEYKATCYGKSSTGGEIQGIYAKKFTTYKAPSGIAATYFAHLATSELKSIGEWPTTAVRDGNSSMSGKAYKANAGVTEDTFSEENSIANNLYGMYDMGAIDIISSAYNKTATGINSKWRDSGDLNLTVSFLYYNDYEIDDVVEKYVGYQLKSEQFADAAAFAKYEDALKEVVRLAQYPKKIDYVTTIQPQIEGAIAALDSAYKELTKAGTVSSGADIQVVKNALEAIETNPDRDINFQDYALFEYFQYEKQRTAAREMINNCTPPSAPEKYIENESASAALIDEIIAAQKNANVITGINATVINPKAEDEVNYQAALKAFKPVDYTLLAMDDQAAKLSFYANLMKANTRTVDKTFLNKEIAYAEAQNYVSSLYSADSWSRYADALAEAKRLSADAAALESETFDAKYELMVAQNKLQLKERSMKESHYMDEELIPLIAHANAVLDNYGTIYAVKAGITEADAFAQLVKALGVAYNVNVDGKDYSGILYNRSALTFKEYDRTANAKNKRAVDAAADKLRAAIENFESTAKLEAKDETTAVDQTVRFIQGIVPGSIASAEQLLARVTVTGGTAVTSASKAGNYGTGARVEIKNGDILLATYFVVIYGDVNGDGAVDAFDAIEVDVANCTAHYMGDVYDDAADVTGDGKIDAADYSALVAAVKCDSAISQNPNA